MKADRPARADDFERIRGLLETALGGQACVACTGVDGDPQTLYPEERTAIARAVLRRQREFAAGRAAARDAMQRIGLKPAPIPVAPDRAPVWPTGLTGSISHTHRICVAVVAHSQTMGTIGVDVEERVPIEPALWDSICTAEERQHIQSLPEERQGHTVAQLFSAKEAFYKWQYPLTGLLLDFQDVTVQLDARHGSFTVRPADKTPRLEGLSRMAGGILEDPDWVITWVCGHPDRHAEASTA